MWRQELCSLVSLIFFKCCKHALFASPILFNRGLACNRYPWQVVSILSRAATKVVAPGIRARGLEEQCRVLEFPGHDVGFGMFLWMFQLEMVFLSGSYFGPPRGMPCFGHLKDESLKTSCVEYGAEYSDTIDVRRQKNRDAIIFHKVQNLTAAHNFVATLGENETQLGFDFHYTPFRVPGFGYTNFSRSFDPQNNMISSSTSRPKWRPMKWEECSKLWARPEEHQVQLTADSSPFDVHEFETSFASLYDQKKKIPPKLNKFLAQLKSPPDEVLGRQFRKAATEFWLSRRLKYPTCRPLGGPLLS